MFCDTLCCSPSMPRCVPRLFSTVPLPVFSLSQSSWMRLWILSSFVNERVVFWIIVIVDRVVVVVFVSCMSSCGCVLGVWLCCCCMFAFAVGLQCVGSVAVFRDGVKSAVFPLIAVPSLQR